MSVRLQKRWPLTNSSWKVNKAYAKLKKKKRNPLVNRSLLFSRGFSLLFSKYKAVLAAAIHSLRLFFYSFSKSASQTAAEASDGIRQSPRGESVTDPTLGPSGKQLRLNCWAKKRR